MHTDKAVVVCNDYENDLLALREQFEGQVDTIFCLTEDDVAETIKQVAALKPTLLFFISSNSQQDVYYCEIAGAVLCPMTKFRFSNGAWYNAKLTHRLAINIRKLSDREAFGCIYIDVDEPTPESITEAVKKIESVTIQSVRGAPVAFSVLSKTNAATDREIVVSDTYYHLN